MFFNKSAAKDEGHKFEQEGVKGDAEYERRELKVSVSRDWGGYWVSSNPAIDG